MSGHSKLSLLTILASALGACGGGGGSADNVSSVPPPPVNPTKLPEPMPAPVTTPSQENFDTSEYRHSSAAVGSNAIGAWQAGATGKGVTLGFVDTGLVPTLSDFQGRIHPGSRDFAGNREMTDAYGHGTAVAGIAAAARDGRGMQGIAYEATIFMAKADQGCPRSCHFDMDDVADGIDAARLAGAKAINLSLVGDADSGVRSAVQRAVNAGIIVVIGAGNSGSRPSEIARNLASVAPDQVIIVGALGADNPDGSINYDVPAIYTTPAGSSQNSFLAAPGWLNSASYFKLEGSFDKLSGTSFAAPVVTGAIALLAQAFPMLTPKQIVLLLYMSADDLGAAGTDATFGRGRLNIGRAFLPIGSVRLASNMTTVPKSLGMLPAAAGDAGRRGRLKATVLDSFDRPFDFNLAPTLSERATVGPLAASLLTSHTAVQSQIGPIALAYSVDTSRRSSLSVERLGLSDQQERSARLVASMAIARLGRQSSVGLGLATASSELRDQLSGRHDTAPFLAPATTATSSFGGRPSASIAYAHRLGGWNLAAAAEKGSVALPHRQPSSSYGLMEWSAARVHSHGWLRLGATWLREEKTMLGGSFHEKFGLGKTTTWFADLELEQELGQGWVVRAAYRRGWTAFPAGQVRTSAASIDLIKAGLLTPSDALAFRLSQPLRVGSGAIGITLPVSWDYRARVATEEHQLLGLAPSGREIFIEAGYARSTGRGHLSLHAYTRRHPDHVRSADWDTGIALRQKLKF